MTPVERAAEVYRLEPCARTFREDLEAHLLNGYVLNTPTCFLMARPVERMALESFIVDPWHIFPPEQCDCWHIYLCAGDMLEALGFAPYPLPWLSWERKNKLRFWPWDKACPRVASKRI